MQLAYTQFQTSQQQEPSLDKPKAGVLFGPPPRYLVTMRRRVNGTTEGTGHDPKALPIRNWRITKYFYVNDKLHKVIQQNRGLDSVVSWCYVDRCRYRYSLSELRTRAGKAYSTGQVEKLIGRHQTYIAKLVADGTVKRPQQTYTLDGNFSPGKFKWSEKDILELHDYFANTHSGRPRKDGLITARAMPSRAELVAMMRNDTAVYVKEGERFVPVWKHDW